MKKCITAVERAKRLSENSGPAQLGFRIATEPTSITGLHGHHFPHFSGSLGALRALRDHTDHCVRLPAALPRLPVDSWQIGYSESLAQRKPKELSEVSGPTPKRTVVRVPSGEYSHEPPRRTRSSPASGPVGLWDGERP